MKLKLHRIEIEVGNFIAERKGRLVPIKVLRENFKSHRLEEAVFNLIAQGVVYEHAKYKNQFGITVEGKEFVEAAYEKLQRDIKKGKEVPEVVEKDDPADAKVLKEQERALAERQKTEAEQQEVDDEADEIEVDETETGGTDEDKSKSKGGRGGGVRVRLSQAGKNGQ